MAIPANWTTVTVRHTYLSVSGEPMRGSVTFETSARVRNPSQGVTLVPSAHVVNLDGQGSLSVPLPVVDDPDTTPNGWFYTVTENLIDGTGTARTSSYQIQITSAMAPEINLVDLIPGEFSGTFTKDATVLGNLTIGLTSGAGKTLTLRSNADGGLDTFDSTSRLVVQSWQTAGNNFFGEGIRLDLMRAMSKNMIAWRLPDPPNNPDPSSLKTVVWAGAHYYAQDQPDPNNPTDVHGHWSVEVPDALRRLRTRFEIKFVDAAGNVGLDKTLVQTSGADFVVDCSNGQVLRLRTGAGAGKFIEWNNDQWGTATRWRVGVPPGPESGGNSGSNFVIERFNDTGVSSGAPMLITRSTGRVTFGGTDGSQSGVDINRNSVGAALGINTLVAGGTGYAHNVNDLATSRTIESRLSGAPNASFVQFADGKHEWGDGTNARDTNLYRASADTLKTDDSLHVGATFRHLGSQLGFYNATPIAKPTVSGSQGGNTALQSLLVALANLGLITDNTSG